MKWNPRGIKAETAEELEQVKTPNGIRKRIFEASFNDPIVRRCFDLAMREGWAGEDMYALLAYHAIAEKQRLEQMLLDQLNACPNPPIFVNKGAR